MAINGINSINNWSYYINYQQAVNKTRLTQALSKNPVIADKLDKYEQSGSSAGLGSSKNFLKEYNSAVSGLMSSANTLRNVNSKSPLNELTAKSSDTDVADVKVNYTVRETAKYDLEVSQTASAQVNSSEFVSGSALASGDMNFAVESADGGRIDVNVSSVKENGGQKTNYQMMKEAAEQINKGDSGVRAEVVVDDGKTSLKLTSEKTGAANGFTVSGDEGAAKGIKETAQEGRDAVYKVTKEGVTREYTSSTNEISLDYGRMTATLKKAGEVSVSTGLDDGKVVSAVKDLVANYNKTLNLLNDNASRGSGVINQIRNMAMAPASEKSMELIGITVNKDGTLKLDESKLKESLNKDPSLTKDILGGSFGVAQGAFNDAVKGMGANSLSLISNDISSLQGYGSINDPLGNMSFFANSGSWGRNNYSALGLMFDMLV
ncbi:flagellar filament capping protein FliD [Anaerotignum faecicola]|nr:flagellar filament capping protein FliD [Anaerotignum faecicola]